MASTKKRNKKYDPTRAKRLHNFDPTKNPNIPVTPAELGATWDEVQNLYQENLKGLSSILEFEGPLKEMEPYIDDKQYLNSVLNTLVNDTAQLKAELDAIYQHVGDRRGPCSEDDIMEYFQVAEALAQWLVRYESVLQPNHDAIMDLHYQATLKMNAENGGTVEVQSVQEVFEKAKEATEETVAETKE